MEARIRPGMGGQARQTPEGDGNLVRDITTILRETKLEELGERKNEDKLAKLLENAGVIGKECARREEVGKTQMMNIMGHIRSLGSNPTIADITRLRAYFAYQIAKEPTLRILWEALEPWFDQINLQWKEVKDKEEDKREEWTRKVFNNFVLFVESVVAFHRYWTESKKKKETERR